MNTVPELPEDFGNDLAGTADPVTSPSANQDRYFALFHQSSSLLWFMENTCPKNKNMPLIPMKRFVNGKTRVSWVPWCCLFPTGCIDQAFRCRIYPFRDGFR